MIATRHDTTYGRSARNRLAAIETPGLAGALAAVETFYHAFNNGDLDVFTQVWVPDELIRLNNPLGGILEGIGPIAELYRGIFDGPADVWVEFHDIVAYEMGDAAVFAGRERGEFAKNDTVVPLEIRTTRIFGFVGGRWGQIHHHGSITDAVMLEAYRAAVQS
jgi:ketosteroid isomerase-like protein